MATDLNLVLGVDLKPLQRGLQGFRDEFNKSIGSVKPSLVNAAAGFTALNQGIGLITGTVGRIADTMGEFIQASSDAEETASKFGVVFKNNLSEASAAVENLRDNFGLATQTAQDLLGATGDLLTGFGFTGSQALELSEGVQTLAVDLASFTNFSGGAEGASSALTKALLGEREAIKSLGIAILESDVKARVKQNEALGKTIGLTDRQAKAFATLELAQEQSKNAIGDFARTQDSFANVSRVASERLLEIRTEIGDKLLPLATEFKKGIVDLASAFKEFGGVDRIVRDLDSAFEALIGTLVALGVTLAGLKLVAVAKAIGGIAGAMSLLQLATNFVTGAFIGLRTAIASTGIGLIIVGLSVFVTKLVEARQEVNSFGEAFGLVFENIKRFFTGDDLIEVEGLRAAGQRAASELGDGIQEKLSQKQFQAQVNAEIATKVNLETEQVQEEFDKFIFGFLPPIQQVRIETQRALDTLNDFVKKGVLSQEKFADARAQIEKKGYERILDIQERAKKEEQRIASSRSTNFQSIFKNFAAGFGAATASETFEGQIAGLGAAIVSKGLNSASDLFVGIAAGIGQVFGSFFGVGGEVGSLFGQLFENLSADADEFDAKLSAGIKSGADFFSNVARNFQKGLQIISTELPKTFKKFFSEDFPKILEELIANLPEQIESGGIGGLFLRIIVAFVKSIPRLLEAFGRGFGIATGKVAQRFKDAMNNAIKGLPGKLADAIRDAFIVLRSEINRIASGFASRVLDGARGFIGRILEGAQGFVSAIINGIKDKLPSIPGIGGGGGGFPGLPSFPNPFGFASGGIVPGGPPFTDRVPAMLTPGEVVLSRDQVAALGGGGEGQNVTIILKISDQELSRTMVNLNRKGLRMK